MGARTSSVLRHRAALRAGALLALLVLSGCGTLVQVSGDVTPPPPACYTPRPATATDSFATRVTTTVAEQGLAVGEIRLGCGATPASGKAVTLQFTAWLASGTEVGSTRGAGQPLVNFTLGDPNVSPPFWNLGVPGMRVGGVRRIVVPPALGFGSQGNTSAGIPANATLIIDLELVKIG